MKDESCNEFWYLSLTNQPNAGQNEKCTGIASVNIKNDLIRIGQGIESIKKETSVFL